MKKIQSTLKCQEPQKRKEGADSKESTPNTKKMCCYTVSYIIEFIIDILHQKHNHQNKC